MPKRKASDTQETTAKASKTTEKVVNTDNSDHSCGFRDPSDISSFEFTGLCVAPHTAFKDNYELDLSTIPKQIERLMRNNVYAAFICGTMGESVSMTVSERKLVCEKWTESAKGKDFTIFCHVGCECLNDTIELAKHAVENGCLAIALTPPSFFKPADMNGLINWLAAVGAAVPKTPMYYYHFDGMTGVNFPTHILLQKAHEKCPTLCGMKYTNYNLFELERCINLNKYNLLLGREDTLLGGLAVGVRGGIGATFCVCGHEMSLLIESFKKGDLKDALIHQKHCNDLADVLYYNQGKYGPGIGGCEILKSIMKLTGLNVGIARLPRGKLTAAAEKLLKEDLNKIDFFKWCDK